MSNTTNAVEDFLLLGREHPLAFAKVAMPAYSPQPFHRDIAAALKKVESGELKRLVLSMPPRYGKSQLCSIFFPAWAIGRHPDWRIIQSSYSTDLARAFGRRARNLLGTPEYRAMFPGVTVAQDTKAADVWNIAGADGGYIAAGVGAGIVGHGADIALIDDPFADPESASSNSHREKVWEWYTEVLKTRLQGMRAIVLVQTRWNSDDLAGRVIAEDHLCMVCGRKDAESHFGHDFRPLGDGWTVISFPALRESPDGEFSALWPAQHSVEDLLKLKAQNPRSFAALYQQDPTPETGTVFNREWFQNRYAALPEKVWFFQSIDTAFKTGIGNDFSVVATWATNGRDFYLAHVWRGRVEYVELKLKIIDSAARFRPRAVLIEDAAAGQSIIQELRRTTGLPIVPVASSISKERRASADAVTSVFESGRVLLPEKAPWLDEWIEEHIAFPGGAHDDQVDATSMALGWASTRRVLDREMVAITTPSAAAVDAASAGKSPYVQKLRRRMHEHDGHRIAARVR